MSLKVEYLWRLAKLKGLLLPRHLVQDAEGNMNKAGGMMTVPISSDKFGPCQHLPTTVTY